MSRLLTDVEHLLDHAEWMNLEGQALEAITVYSEVLDRLSHEPPSTLQCRALRGVGLSFRGLGEIRESALAYEEALEVAEACGNKHEQAEALNGLAIATQLAGDLELAECHYAAAASLSLREGLFQLMGVIEQNRGVIAADRGDYVSARKRYKTALRAFETADDVQGVCWTLNNMGLLSADAGHLHEALDYFDQAREVSGRALDRALGVRIEINRATALLGAGELELAYMTLDTAIGVARTTNAPLLVAEGLRYLARVERESGKPWNGLRWVHQALDVAEAGHDALLLAEVRREAGACWLALGDTGRARSALEAASRQFAEIGAHYDRTQVEQQLEELTQLT